jgi:hypothetical protein
MGGRRASHPRIETCRRFSLHRCAGCNPIRLYRAKDLTAVWASVTIAPTDGARQRRRSPCAQEPATAAVHPYDVAQTASNSEPIEETMVSSSTTSLSSDAATVSRRRKSEHLFFTGIGVVSSLLLFAGFAPTFYLRPFFRSLDPYSVLPMSSRDGLRPILWASHSSSVSALHTSIETALIASYPPSASLPSVFPSASFRLLVRHDVCGALAARSHGHTAADDRGQRGIRRRHWDGSPAGPHPLVGLHRHDDGRRGAHVPDGGLEASGHAAHLVRRGERCARAGLLCASAVYATIRRV